jgi:hypothetical protein
MKVVHTQNSLDLSEKSSQEPKVSSGHPYEATYDFRDELFVRECCLGILQAQLNPAPKVRKNRFQYSATAISIFGGTPAMIVRQIIRTTMCQLNSKTTP